MSTITAILEADADGMLHVPVPEELRGGKVAIVATLTAANTSHFGAPATAPVAVSRRMAALSELRSLGGLSDVIPDPVEWQREQRLDRPLPGRE